ncbi:MAG TPA: glycosyltransferase family 39 protein, partial [Anaerolineae bacterium]|nr:glycosyltransferase family 39 protein [Anaerolineae bacterium]
MVSRTGLDKISRAAVKTGRVGRVLVGAAVIVWLSVVLVSYYIIHKPFSIENALALANVFGDALVVGMLTCLAFALGHRLLRGWEFDSPLEASVLWLGMGLGAVGLIVFALGLVEIVNTWVYWGLLAASLLLLRKDVRAVWQTVRVISLPRASRSEKAIALFCLLAFAITFLFALTPPCGWDGLQYHLIIPKLLLAQGRIVPPPDNPSLNFPSLVEMLFLAGMVLKDDGATQLLHWIFLPLTLGAILVFARRYFSWRVGWLAAALFCAVPTVVLLATWAYNDLALTFYTFSAFLLTLRARETNQPRDFILAGILCGLAFGEKYTAILVPLALALVVVGGGVASQENGNGTPRPNRAALKSAALLLVSATVMSAPWIIRNSIFVGNPIYPFAFGGLYWDSFRSAWYSRFGSGLLQRPVELLIVPWTMTVQGTQSDLFQGTLGPLLLALLPLNLIPVRPSNARPAP